MYLKTENALWEDYLKTKNALWEEIYLQMKRHCKKYIPE